MKLTPGVILRDVKNHWTNSTSIDTYNTKFQKWGRIETEWCKGREGNQSRDTLGNKTGLQPVSKPGEQELGYANV